MVGVGMSPNASRKGRRSEWKSRDLFEAAGYYVCRAGGSLGMWDLIAIGPDKVVVCQVKSNRPPRPAERALLAAFPCPPNCERVVHVWHDRERAPRITVM